ncbi:MAG: O-antigen ligase family protein [Xanthomonadales bacterium]
MTEKAATAFDSRLTMKRERKAESLGIPLSALAIPLLLGIFLLITSTRYLSSTLALFDVKRMIEIMIFGAILAIAIIDPRLRMELVAQFRRIPRWIGLGLVGFIGLGVVSSVFNAASPFALAYSLADVYLLAIMIVLTLVVAACRSIAGTRFDQLVMFCLAMLGLAVGVQELIGVAVAWSAGLQFSYDVALTHFSHARFYNQLQSWTVPLLTALPVVFSRHRLAALPCILVLGLHWYILLMTGARGSTLSLLVAFGVTLLLFPGARRLIIKWQAAGILLGVLIYILMFLGPATGHHPIDTATALPVPVSDGVAVEENPGTAGLPGETPTAIANRYFKLSLGRPMLHSSGRLKLWSTALGYAEENPLLGIGPMNFACTGPFFFAGHPHNSAMQLLSEWGLPATLLALGILLTLLGCLVTRLRVPVAPPPEQWLLQVMLFTSVLAAILHSGLSGLLIMPASQVAAVLVCGWLLGSINSTETRVIDSPAEDKVFHYRSASTPILIISLMATLMLWLFAIHEIKNMNHYEKQIPAIEWGTPRFWNSGKVCSLHMQPE